MTKDVDVVVVGAGLSGLIAARELRRRGVEVLVLEAADRCGGRALSRTSTLGSRLDLGGQWVGHDHHRLAALSDELGATRFTMHTPAVPTAASGSRRIRVCSPAVVVALLSLLVLSVARVTRSPAAWRTTTVARWLTKVPGESRRLLEVAALISWTADLDRLSVRTMMSLIEVQGGLTTMLTTKGGAQHGLIVEGVGHLVDRLVESLGPAVRTGMPVTSVVRTETGAIVRTAYGDVSARTVIVAVPPPVAARIHHEPALPADRSALQQHTFMGSVYKAVAVYPEPWWRANRSAEMLLLDRPGVAVFDTSVPGGPGHLCLLVGGDEARDLDDLEPERRRTLLLERLAVHLGDDVLRPADWHEKSWHLDPHVGGGYLALPDAGAEREQLPMPMPTEPIGPVHWAGSETAADHPGYLDGAIEAGERAAREVVAALRKGEQPSVG